MGITGQRHEDAEDILEMKASCHATELRMDRAECYSTSSAYIGLTVGDNLFHKEVDFCAGESVSRAGAEATQSFTGYVTHVLVRVDNEGLYLVS